MMSYKLDSSRVDDIFTESQDDDGDVEVDGIAGVLRFNSSKLNDHRDEIAGMLLELPDPFMKSKGGGWSFLNACDDNHGNQWTGLHQTMARLFYLGMAIEMVTSPMPRELWSILPGSMPYYIVDDTK